MLSPKNYFVSFLDPFALKRNVARSLNSQMVFEYILERFRTAYKYFACPQNKDGIKSKLDTKKKEKGKIGSKKTGELVTNCCLQQQANIAEKQNTDNGYIIQACEFNECSEMEPTSRRRTSNNLEESFLVNKPDILNKKSEDQEETVSLSECCELEQKLLKANDQEPSVEEELSHHCIFSEHGSHNTDANDELSDPKSRQNSEKEHSQKSMCSGTTSSTTSHNCQAVGEIQNTKDEVNTEDMHYVFDKFILTSGKVMHAQNLITEVYVLYVFVVHLVG